MAGHLEENAILPNLLALDTSNHCCSVALQYGGLVSTNHVLAEQKQSALMLPMVRELLHQAGANLSDLSAVVAGIGPGGFTGVRLAVSVAQGLAFALGLPVLAHSSLGALAVAAGRLANADIEDVLVAMDARMHEVYWARYAWVEGALVERHPPALSRVDDFIAQLAQYPSARLVGNAVAAFAELHAACGQMDIVIPPIDHSAPHAADLLPLANAAWRAGATLPPAQVQPLYVRNKIAQTMAERAQVSS